MRYVQFLLILPAILWASPWTLFGMFFGVLAVATGGGVQWPGRAVEFWGGCVAWMLKRFLLEGGASAITFGHVVLGRTRGALDDSRRHELVHVRQYERWGPFFIPAYLLCSLVLWLRGRDYYRDNPFEIEAYDEAG